MVIGRLGDSTSTGGDLIGLLSSNKTTVSSSIVQGTHSCFPESVKIIDNSRFFEVRHHLPIALLTGMSSTSQACTSGGKWFHSTAGSRERLRVGEVGGPRCCFLEGSAVWGPAGRLGLRHPCPRTPGAHFLSMRCVLVLGVQNES